MIVDEHLLDRLDRTAAYLALEMADGYRTVEPGGSTAVRPFGHGALVALGPGRWVNRAIGIPAPVDPTSLDELEAFFAGAGVPPSIEVGMRAAPSALSMLASRGYTTEWFRDLFVVPPGVTPADAAGDVTVRGVDAQDAEEWTDVFTGAFGAGSPTEAATALLHARALLPTDSTAHFVATIDGDVAGCASLSIVDGVAWLGGAGTLTAFRARGVQTALLHHRLALAAGAGCEVAAATAVPAGPSARNLRRVGFELATSQAVMTLAIRTATQSG